MPKITRRDVLKWGGVAVAGALGGTAFGLLSSSEVRVERRTLRLPRWSANGFRIAVLADFHLVDDEALERSLVACRLAIDERPDVIAMVGDYVESTAGKSLTRLEKLLSAFESAACPVVAVMGNHDYWAEQPARIISLLREANKVALLRNSASRVGEVTVFGVDDAINGRHKPELASDHGATNVIALFHEPDYVRTLPPSVSLHIAGHSHGGQICLPGGKPLMLPKGARKYWRGFYSDTKVPLYVTRGIGMTGPQARAFCPPEVSVLTLAGAA